MKLLSSAVALLALMAASPAFASDYSTDRHFAQGTTTHVRAPQASPAVPEARAVPETRKDARGCECACMRRGSDEHPASSRVDPGRR